MVTIRPVMLQIDGRGGPVILATGMDRPGHGEAALIFGHGFRRDGGAIGQKLKLFRQIESRILSDHSFRIISRLNQKEPVIVRRREGHIGRLVHIQCRADIERAELGHPVPMIPRKPMADTGTTVVPDHGKSINSERGHDFRLVPRHLPLGIWSMRGIRLRLTAVSVTAQIRRYDSEFFGQDRRDLVPDDMGLRIAVQQEKAGAIATNHQFDFCSGGRNPASLKALEHALSPHPWSCHCLIVPFWRDHTRVSFMDTSLHPNDAFAGFGKAARTAFMLERDYAHLNHGSYGATPVSVLAAQRVWQDRLELEPSRFMRREYKPAMRAAAEALAPRLGVEADGVVLVENVTQAVNAILRELQLPAGAEILITDQTYGAVRNTVRHNCKRNGWTLRDVALPFPAASAEHILAAFKAALTPAPALVIIDHVTSPTALVMPLVEMAAAAREAGALVLVDGAHAPGMLDLDISQIPCDWYTGNCHKWMFAPKGCGFLWSAEARRDDMHPLAISHWYEEGYTVEFDYVGTRDASSMLCMPSVLAFMDAHGPARIRAHNHALVNDAADMLSAAWKTGRGAGPALTGSIAMVRLPDGLGTTQGDADALRNRLVDEFRVQIPINALTGTLWCRLSAQIYNEMGDYERLESAITKLAG